MKTLTTCLFFLVAISLQAQSPAGLLVEYDLYTNKVTYSRNGVTLEKPTAKNGENIYVHLLEFNPYVMTATIQVDNGNYANSSGLELGSEIAGGGGSSFSGFGSLFGDLSLGANVTSLFQSLPGSRGQQDLAMINAKSQYQKLLGKLEQTELRINKAKSKIHVFKNVSSTRAFASQDIAALRQNKHIKPSRVKELIIEEVLTSFAKVDTESISLDDVVDAHKLETDYKQAIIEYNAAREDYIALSQQWQALQLIIGNIDWDNLDRKSMFVGSSTDSIVNAMEANINTNLNSPLESISTEVERTRAQLADLRRVYEEMQGQIFEYRFPPIQAEGNTVSLQMNVDYTDELGSSRYKSLHQTIPVKGSWRISGGIGVAFGVLKDQSYQYSNLDGIVVGTESDQFTPMITSLAHIYKNTRSGIGLGGSFGVGFPLSSSGGISSAAFFGGPTIVIGNQQKFLLSFGVMGARVDRLGAGLAIGDEITTTFITELPSISRYELGYFVSISYDFLK